ncbi:MAG: metal ABC transporter substrate-binding protein [Atopobiaceae bacterium]|nr:metal ABC transporter substrate-binding protein [Atopobiaceae bacterium]
MLVLAALVCACALCACMTGQGTTDQAETSETKRTSIVTTNFAEYDFARQVAGDAADVSLLLKPGADAHSYEPTPQDIVSIQDSDLFVYVGGDSDAWVDDVIGSMDQSRMHPFRLMDNVDTVDEVVPEGMQDDEDDDTSGDDAPEQDEHVWTSPVNAMRIVRAMCDELCRIDPDDAETYRTNTDAYLGKLQELDDEFRDVAANAKRTEIVVGDRFPFRYLCDEYGITYYAAFPGCSTETEASASTVAFLIDKVKQDDIPVVFHIELSDERMCDSICAATGAKKELLDAVHNVSEEDFDAGVTYVDLMQHDVEVLREALD